MNLNFQLPAQVERILADLSGLGVQSFFVGGCVRDALLGLPSDDVDFCLVGVEDTGLLTQVLERHADGVAAQVGNQFPVWIARVGDEHFDFALARTENSTGGGTQDFTVHTQGVTIEMDLRRRDLTLNAVAVNTQTGELVDPFGGVSDLQNGVAREVSEAFAEDPLRVLRAARFVSRFNLTPTNSLLEMCSRLSPENISAERVGMELRKMLHQAQTPSLFFQFLLNVGWLGHHFPQLSELVGLEQDPEWHPEGDAFTHTMHTMDAAQDWFTRVVMLCHDLGKAITTATTNGRITARGHADAGVDSARQMLQNIRFMDNAVIEQVSTLVGMHMIHTNPPTTRRGVARVLRTLQANNLTFDQLVEVCRCDVSGRPPIEGFTPDIGQGIANELLAETEAGEGMNPIVNGRMLIEAGIRPSPQMGELLREMFNLQMDGQLTAENWTNFLP